MTEPPRRVVLASESPRRRDLLAGLGIEFEVAVPAVEEVGGGDPAADVLENARRKAEAVSRRLDLAGSGAIVIACDTDVVDSGEILGKPQTAEQASGYLRRLAGRSHEVLSGLVVREHPDQCAEHRDQHAEHPDRRSENADPRAEHSDPHGEDPDSRAEDPCRRGENVDQREGLGASRVRFRELTEEEISAYVATGEWRGRAGGYAIQGWGSALIAGVEGDVTNVIGLPVPVLMRLAPGLSH